MKIIRPAYFFLNVFNKIKDNPNWGHISVLVSYLTEIVDEWYETKYFNSEILCICLDLIEEFNYSIDVRKDMVTFSESEIMKLSNFMEKYLEEKSMRN